MLKKQFEHEAECSVHEWLFIYKATHREFLQNNQEFAKWLDNEYVPIAGGWQY